jgi:hypothetical protein
MSVRAKMTCIEITRRQSTVRKGNDWVPGEVQQVKLQAVCSSPENEKWSSATPYGEVVLGISNPEAVNQFDLGKSYFVDFTLAE